MGHSERTLCVTLPRGCSDRGTVPCERPALPPRKYVSAVKRPDMALQRLIRKGSLRPTKIGGRNVFKREDLDRIRAKGDQARRRGRPRKDAT